MKSIKPILVAGIILLIVSSNGIILCAAESPERVVLVTGFEPFGGNDINPSQLIAENISGRIIDGATVIGLVVPVIYGGSVNVITDAIDTYDPCVVISIGMGAGLSKIHVEKVGINIKSAKIPDNEGNMVLFRRIAFFGPLIRLSSLPVRQIVNEMKNANISAKISFHAGTFICNEVLYGVLRHIAKNDFSINAGFIHVPLLSSQNPEKGMELETMIEATEIAIKTSLNR